MNFLRIHLYCMLLPLMVFVDDRCSNILFVDAAKRFQDEFRCAWDSWRDRSKFMDFVAR